MLEAWQLAGLDADPPAAGTLVVAGSNLQQRDTAAVYAAHRDAPARVRASHGLTFLDTDLVGCLSQVFGLHGEGYTLGGASASGNLALIHAARHVRSGEADVAVVVAPIMRLSVFELHGLAGLGAMGGERCRDAPDRACRPFDRDRDGFIYGEGCGCVIVESRARAARRGAASLGVIAGYGVHLDGHRDPDPSAGGEAEAMRRAVAMSGIDADRIDYVNTHGSGSVLGDACEVEALRQAGLSGARLNATKSLTGHTLSAAGAIEAIATLIQMHGGFLHPTRNLDCPIAGDLCWVRAAAELADIRYALNHSVGFSGINTAIVFRAAA
jgi:malonyl-ACP decarboxylase